MKPSEGGGCSVAGCDDGHRGAQVRFFRGEVAVLPTWLRTGNPMREPRFRADTESF
jgi:hypothetical protein